MAIVIVHGDVKCILTGEEFARFVKGACHTRAMKNYFKRMKELSKVKCKCVGYTRKNHRITGQLPANSHAWIFHVLHECEAVALPEKRAAAGDLLTYPIDLGSPARQLRRGEACDRYRNELDVHCLHMTNDHSLCKHAALPEDFKYFTCPVQKGAFKVLLGDYKEMAPELITDIGLVHVQYNESMHKSVANHRPKGFVYSPAACALGEVLAILEHNELQFYKHDVVLHHQEAISVMLKTAVGVDYTPPANTELMKSLRDCWKQAEHRQTSSTRRTEPKSALRRGRRPEK